jgi:hypothetical protein
MVHPPSRRTQGTAAKWEASHSITAGNSRTRRMLQYIEELHAPSSRKLRLLATAYARFLETQPEYADSKHVAHLGEEVAEGRRTLDELWDQQERGWGFPGNWAIANLVLTRERIGNKIRAHLSGVIYQSDDPVACETAAQRHCAALRSCILCVLGNPFRPVTLDPSWRTSDVMLLAQIIYDERAFEQMPILGDALQDAGCDCEEVLTHCRDVSLTHVRGCWVADLVLGKS